MRKFASAVLFSLLMLVSLSALCTLRAQERPWSQRAANAAMARWPEGRLQPPGARWVWNYELGTLLEGMDSVWLNTADPRYYNYIKASVDQFLAPDGSIPTYKVEEYQLDSILLGRQLLLLYGITEDKRYLTAATPLYQQLLHQPRTAAGGFWHKQKYPYQMWLDGLYMAEPFFAEYASLSHHPEAFADIAHQFEQMEEHARDPKTGLLYHGWDESKQERWASKQTGLSQNFWGRGMGWYMMALVDTLDYLPQDDPARKQLLALLARDAAAIARVQDGPSGLWFQVLDKPAEKGNYLESSASCMFVYALAKGVRRGYLPPQYLANAERGYKGILARFIQTGPGDNVSLTQTVKGAGLGGDPYRDGTYQYYIGEKIATDDAKGVGAFLLAAAEMENAANARLGRGKTVMVDAWFNSQTRPDAFGQQVSFHYKWNDQSNGGFSLLGHAFRSFGAQTATLFEQPTLAALRHAQVYLIVSPDIPVKNPNPHYAEPKDADEIAAWVKAGGVLVMLENDPANADLDHFNAISEKFGIHFNSVLRKHVIGTQWDLGKLAIPGGGPVFHNPHTAYIKDVCTISVKAPAASLVTDSGDIMMATARFGKGAVFAAVDPWLYNEYTDGRKLPAEYDNYAAGKELVRWILEQVPSRPKP